MKLFEDQQELVDKLGLKFKAGHKRVVACSQTGSGKTVIGGELARRARIKGNRVGIFVYREEIMLQFAKVLQSFGIYPGIIAPGYTKPNRSNGVFLGMIQTVNRRLQKGILDWLELDFCILDEIHRGEFYNVTNQLDCKVVGFTATPKTANKNYELNEYYDDIVVGLTTQQLINLGRLCRGVTYALKPDLSGVKKKGKEFDDKSLLEAFRKAELYDGAIDRYYELCPERKAIHYCVNIDHALEKVVQHKNRGVKNLYHVDGESCFKLIDGELLLIPRKDAMNMFYHDKHAIMTNVGVATTGTDFPDVGAIIQDFATMSITKHHQVIGRGGRVCNGKDDFIIIDAGRNWVRHKAYGDHVEWESIFREPKKFEVNEQQERRDKRECEECNMLIGMRTKICPFCNTIYSEGEIEQALMEGATAEEVRQWKYDKLPVDLRKPVGSLDLTQMREYGRLMGYSPKWANMVWAKRQERKRKYGNNPRR